MCPVVAGNLPLRRKQMGRHRCQRKAEIHHQIHQIQEIPKKKDSHQCKQENKSLRKNEEGKPSCGTVKNPACKNLVIGAGRILTVGGGGGGYF